MHQMTLSPAIGYASIQLLAPLAADRPWKPPTSSSLADEKRLHSLLLSTAAGDPVFNCSLRSLRIALGSRRLRRHSQTRSVSTRSSSARQRAIQYSIARSARCGSPLEAADFVVTRRREASPLAPPQHGSGRSGRLDFGSFATIRSYEVSIRS